MRVWQVCVFFKILMRNNEGGNEKQEIYLVWPKKSVRVHFAPAEIAITFELLSQFLRFLDQNDRHSLGVLLIY